MIDAAALLAHPGLEVDYRYDQREVMLHALATALPTDPMDTDQLPFAYEDLPNQPLLALPTLPIILGWVDLVRDPRTRDPMLGIDGDQVVVGQASLVLHRAIAAKGSGRTRTFYAEVVDKGAGRGALVCVRREVCDATHGLLATIDTWLFVRGAGGFGGPHEGGPPRTPVPARAPDGVIENGTSAQQNGQTDIRIFNIEGTEQRLNLALGYRTGWALSGNGLYFMQFGGSMLGTKVINNVAILADRNYDLIIGAVNPAQMTNYQPQTGIGFGYYFSTGFFLPLGEHKNAELSLAFSKDKMILNMNEFKGWNKMLTFCFSI